MTHLPKLFTASALALLLTCAGKAQAGAYSGSVSATGPTAIQAAGTEILGAGGGSGSYLYKGGGNAVDAAVAAALVACVVNTGNCSLGGYGGHMMIWKAGLDGQPQ